MWVIEVTDSTGVYFDIRVRREVCCNHFGYFPIMTLDCLPELLRSFIFLSLLSSLLEFAMKPANANNASLLASNWCNSAGTIQDIYNWIVSQNYAIILTITCYKNNGAENLCHWSMLAINCGLMTQFVIRNQDPYKLWRRAWWHRDITWTSADTSAIRSPGIYFSENKFEMQTKISMANAVCKKEALFIHRQCVY